MAATKKPIALPDDEKSDFESFNLQSNGIYMLFGEVDSDSAKDFNEFLIKANFVFPRTKTLSVLINSPGGSVYDGFGMIDVMDTSRLSIQTIGVGCVASMAALVFVSGTPGLRRMSANSFIMTHQFSDYFEGKFHEMVAARPHVDELHDRFVKHFMSRSSMSEKQVSDILLGSSDKWLSAKEALKLGLCDEIQSPWS